MDDSTAQDAVMLLALALLERAITIGDVDDFAIPGYSISRIITDHRRKLLPAHAMFGLV